MSTTEIIQNVVNIVMLAGMVFAVYKSFQNPLQRSEKTDAIIGEQVKQLRIEFANLRDNHIHSLDLKIDGVASGVNLQAVEIAKLSTIIDERIPRK